MGLIIASVAMQAALSSVPPIPIPITKGGHAL